MAGSTHSDDDMISGINVTPLVDVILVLLVIVMVAASFEVSRRSIPVSLPEASTGESTGSTLVLSLDAEGQWFLDGDRVQEGALRASVREARRNDATVRAVIAADESVAHGRVIELVDLLREERVVDFAFNVAPPSVEAGT